MELGAVALLVALRAELAKLATACGDYETLVLAMGYCGPRWGEASALRVRDVDILRGKLARRNVSPSCLDFGKKEPASHGAVRQRINILQGIDKEKGKQITKTIKESKLKVQTQIMEDQLRVSGKKIDDLQEVIQLLKGKDFGIDLQFINMRS